MIRPMERMATARRAAFGFLPPFIFATFFFFGLSGILPSVHAQPGTVQRQYPSIARIIGFGKSEGTTQGRSQSLFYGSGVYVAEVGSYGIVLTNWHVVDGVTGLLNLYFPEFTCYGAVLLADETWDLTAIVIQRPPFLPLPISLEVPQIDDELWVAGYGQNNGLDGFQMSSGPVLCYSILGTDGSLPRETLAIGTGVRQGDSGGPILNKFGELAGLLWGSDGDMTMGTFSLRLQAFLTQAQYQLIHQPAGTNLFALAQSGGLTVKKISMPAISGKDALASSGVYPISSRPVYQTGRNLPAPQSRVPWFYKPAFVSDLAAKKESTGDNGEDSPPSNDYSAKRKEYLDGRKNGFTIPPYPPIASPTYLAQRESIGHDHPEVYPRDFAIASQGKAGSVAAALLARDEVPVTPGGERVVVIPTEGGDSIGNIPQENPLADKTPPTQIAAAPPKKSTPPTPPSESSSTNPPSYRQVSLGEAPPVVPPLTPTTADGNPPPASEESDTDKPPKKSIREMIPGIGDLPLSDVKTIIVIVLILILFLNAMRLLVVAAERAEKS